MKKILIALSLIVSLANSFELNTQMQGYMNTLKIQAVKDNKNFKDFDYKRGKEIFTSEHIGKKNKLISCVSCHGINLQNEGRNIHTNKIIKPLSPYINTKRLIKVKSVKKWLRRNFRDVYKVEGTAQEKGDVLVYIMNKK